MRRPLTDRLAGHSGWTPAGEPDGVMGNLPHRLRIVRECGEYSAAMAVDHTCPVAWAAERELLFGSPVNVSWCLSHRREALIALPDGDIRVPELLLWQEGPLSVY